MKKQSKVGIVKAEKTNAKKIGISQFVVKQNRPEDLFESREYYERDKRHGESRAIEKIQEQLTLKLVQSLIPGINLDSKILDAGCGSGFSMQTLQKLGFANVWGIDSSKEMIELAKKKRLNAALGELEKIPFEDETFDAIISISALQWVSKDETRLGKTAKEFYRTLKNGGVAGIQFYPKSSIELEKTARTFKSQGFGVKIIIENEENARKRKIFLILKK